MFRYRCQSEVFAQAEHHLPSGVAFVWDFAVENGVLDGVFDIANGVAWTDSESLHDIQTADRWLEIPDAVFLFEFDKFLSDKLVVVAKAFFLLLFF